MVRRALAIIGVIAALSAAIARHGQAAPRDHGQGQADQSREALVRVCSKCHPLERVTAQRRSRTQWEEVMTQMVTSRGAVISDEDFDTVLSYLVREYGRVNVNKAAADEIVEVLALPDKAAAAIVDYRRDHGRFEDFDALAKVPGVDAAKLEQRRDAIVF
jgi:competence protein ComEA